MSRSKNDFRCGSDNNEISRPCNNSRRRNIFPTDIKGLLIILADNDDDRNRATLILDSCPNHCLIEDARIIAVMDNTVVVKDCDKFRYVCIGCICEVVVECQALVEGIFDDRNINRR